MRISALIPILVPIAFLLWELRKKKQQSNQTGNVSEQENKLPGTGVIFFWLVPVGTVIFSYTLLLLCGTGSSSNASPLFLSPTRWLSIILYLLFSGMALYFHHRKERSRSLHCITAILILFSVSLIYEGIKAILQKDIKTLMEHYQGNDAVTQGFMLITIGIIAVVFWLTASILGKKFMKQNNSGQSGKGR